MVHPDPQAASRPRSSLPARDIALLLWAAFLTACIGTMVFFALFDPVLLAHDDAPPPWLADRMTGYACGFFFFWILCSVASLVTAWMIDRRPAQDDL
ncbi:MAG TPA: hypothetical protein VFR96_06575 [Povalibacter sp.]|nr:hypothetical protein [Povalibacter sp.]